MDLTGLTNIIENSENRIVILSDDLMTKAIVNRSFPRMEVSPKSWHGKDIFSFGGYGWWLSAAKLQSREYNEYGDEYIEEWKGVRWTRPSGDKYRSIFIPDYESILKKLKRFGGGMFKTAINQLINEYNKKLEEAENSYSFEQVDNKILGFAISLYKPVEELI